MAEPIFCGFAQTDSVYESKSFIALVKNIVTNIMYRFTKI